MKRVLIAYYSATGSTEKMAQYIAEGVRFSGHEAVVKKIGDIKNASDLAGYDGYIFGSPTFSLDVPGPMKRFIDLGQKAEMEGKPASAFGSYKHDVSYQHDTYAPALILDTLQREYEMKRFELGPFNLQEEAIETSKGMQTCQDYGKVFGEALGG